MPKTKTNSTAARLREIARGVDGTGTEKQILAVAKSLDAEMPKLNRCFYPAKVRRLLAQLKRELLAFSADTVGLEEGRPARGSCHEVLFDMVIKTEKAAGAR